MTYTHMKDTIGDGRYYYFCEQDVDAKYEDTTDDWREVDCPKCFENCQIRRCKILYITDDFDEEKLESRRELDEYYHFRDLIQDFRFIPGYDYVLVDYGLIGNFDKEHVIECLQDYYNHGSILMWYGGLSGRYNFNARYDFPKNKFMHKFHEPSLGEEITHIERIEKGVDTPYW